MLPSSPCWLDPIAVCVAVCAMMTETPPLLQMSHVLDSVACLGDLISIECSAQDKSTLDAFFCFELSRGEGTSVVQHRRFLQTLPSLFTHPPRSWPTCTRHHGVLERGLPGTSDGHSDTDCTSMWAQAWKTKHGAHPEAERNVPRCSNAHGRGAR